MQRFIIIRIFHSILALLAISMIIFFLARISGDPIEMLLPIEATDEEFEQVRAAWGLDKPLPVQYITYLGNVLRGNFGQSIKWQGEDALSLVLERFPATLELAFLSLGVSAAIALPIGVIVAVKKDTGIDFAGKIIALMGQSLPSFWVRTSFNVAALRAPYTTRRRIAVAVTKKLVATNTIAAPDGMLK